MTYGYRDYWAEISPVYNEDRKKVLYWRYEIFSFADDEVLFDGHDSDRSSALATAQAHIENLVRNGIAPAWRAA